MGPGYRHVPVVAGCLLALQQPWGGVSSNALVLFGILLRDGKTQAQATHQYSMLFVKAAF